MAKSPCQATQFVDNIKRIADDKINQVHTAIPGKIVSFDSGTGLATVLPSMQITKPNGEKMDYPKISGVPVVIPQGMGGSAVIAFPVRAGDGCLIIIAEQSLDKWMYERETDTDLRFDLTNAICIPGLFNKANPVLAEACSGNAIIASVGGSRIKVGSGGIEISGDVTVSGTITASGDVSGRNISLSGHGHIDSEGGQTSPPIGGGGGGGSYTVTSIDNGDGTQNLMIVD